METNKTLIAYATKGGVTEESAEIIARVLSDKFKLQVDTINIRKNRPPDITEYENIIIGSGVRIGRWYKQALKFLKNDFGAKKIAIFLSSCEAGDPKNHDQAITKYIKKVLAKHPHIKPIATEAFGGRMKFFGKGVDNHDADKVRAWAEELGKRLIE